MRLGPYELVRPIGAGGMGEVWAAHRATAGAQELIALKRLPEKLASDVTYRQILLEEARLAMLLRHPNIVHVFDAGEADGEAYIAMEFVHGLDLSRLRKLLAHHNERLPADVIAYVMAEILVGLDYAHNLVHNGELLSLVHRDVSPHNVMLSTKGEVKLTDFGVARLSTEDTSGTHVKGKVRYMSPEQLRGESRSPSVDLFAAGAVLQELLDGTVFRGAGVDDATLLGMAVDGTTPPPKYPHEIPAALEQLRRGLLAPDTRQRIASANDALDLLRRWDGYHDAKPKVAELVQRQVEERISPEAQAVLANLAQPPVGLAHQATELHASAAISVARQREPSNEFRIFDEAPSEALLSAPTVTQPDDPTVGTIGELDELGGTNARGPAATGGHPSLDKPKLVLDVAQPSFVRHVATSPNPVVPRGHTVRRLVLGLGLVGLCVGVGFGVRALVDRSPTPRAPGSSGGVVGMQDVRVIGDSHAGYAGFRQRHMDKLTADDLIYHYILEPGEDPGRPLAALAAGEAEFALTTLEQVLLQRSAEGSRGGAEGAPVGATGDDEAMIVAIVDVSLGGDALVLDSAEHPSLRSLADLAKLGAKLDHQPVLAYASGTPSEFFDLHLDALLVTLDEPGLQRGREFDDVSGVYDALVGEVSPDDPVVAALLWEPWVSKAVAAGMSVAVSTRDLPHALVDVLVTRRRTLAERPELVDAVVATYYAGMLAQREDRGELIDQVARDVGLTEAEAAQTLAGLCTLDALGANTWLTGSSGQPPLLASAIAETWSTLRGRGRVEGPAPRVAELVDGHAMAAAASTDQDHDPEQRITCALPGPPAARVDQPLGELELPKGDAQPWFQIGDAAPSGTHASALSELASRLRPFNPATVAVEITGFGDGRGAKARALGKARAQAIVAALQDSGVELPLTARGAGGRLAPSAKLRISLTRAR